MGDEDYGDEDGEDEDDVGESDEHVHVHSTPSERTEERRIQREHCLRQIRAAEAVRIAEVGSRRGEYARGYLAGRREEDFAPDAPSPVGDALRTAFEAGWRAALRMSTEVEHEHER